MLGSPDYTHSEREWVYEIGIDDSLMEDCNYVWLDFDRFGHLVKWRDSRVYERPQYFHCREDMIVESRQYIGAGTGECFQRVGENRCEMWISTGTDVHRPNNARDRERQRQGCRELLG